MKKTISLLLLLLISISAFSQEKEKIVLGVVYDGETRENSYLEKEIKTEILNLMGSKYDIVFPDEKKLIDSFNREDISEKMDQLLADDEVDAVIAGGVLSSYIAIEKRNLSKPVYAPFIINNARLTLNNQKSSGIKNLNYIVTNLDIKTEIENFRKIKDFKKLTILIGKEIMEVIPDLDEIFANYIKANDIDLEFEFVEVESSNIDGVLSQIEAAEAVAIAPIRRVTPGELTTILDYLNENKTPSYSMLGTGDMDLGILAGHSYEKEARKRIRAMAVNMSLAKDGDKVEELQVAVKAAKPELVINMKVIEETGIWPSWDVIADSKLINFESEEDSPMALNLKEVIETSVENNPILNALKEEVGETDLQIKKAKSNYKPDIEASATALVIDQDRAESLLTPAEQTLSAGVSLTQVIFSEDANMNVDVKKEQKKMKKAEYEQSKLDLILEASEAYFTVLKAEAYARIQKQNLEMTKQNLELAKGRKAAGISGPADIYRWESQLANSVTGLISAMLNVDMAKTNLKRIINYDLTQDIDIELMSLDSEYLMTSDEGTLEYISNQTKVDALIKYMVIKSHELSPEIAQIESGVNIYERVVQNTRNKRYMPTVALQAQFTINNIIAEGEGSESADYSGLTALDSAYPGVGSALSGIVDAFGDPDENDWSIGVGFSLPLYSGGELQADREIAQSEVNTLEHQKEGLKKVLEQKVISYTLQIVSEYSKIKNAEISANAADKAFDLVKDAYQEGVASVADLLDAQTASISANQYKSTVMYDLMAAIMRAERAVGSYFIFRSESDRATVADELGKISESL